MRLIDADKLILYLNDYALQNAPFMSENADVYEAIENCMKAEEEQPTAYDIDQLVKQLEELKSMVPVNRVLDNITKDCPKELGQIIAYDRAIKIVKRGEKRNAKTKSKSRRKGI